MKLALIGLLIIGLNFLSLVSMSKSEIEMKSDNYIKQCYEEFRNNAEPYIFLNDHYELINVKSAKGVTALSIAVTYSNFKVVEYLVDNGAEILDFILISAIKEYTRSTNSQVTIIEYLLAHSTSSNVIVQEEEKALKSAFSNLRVDYKNNPSDHIYSLIKLLMSYKTVLKEIYGIDIKREFQELVHPESEKMSAEDKKIREFLKEFTTQKK